MAAPRSAASFARAAATAVAKWEMVTMTGTRPAACSRQSRVRTLRSSSDSRNCSEKLARMQMPSTPWSTMQSMTRFMPSRSRAPSSAKGVGATGQMPV